MNYSTAIAFIKDEAEEAVGQRPTTPQVRDAARGAWILDNGTLPTGGQVTEIIEADPEAVIEFLF